MLTVTHFVLAGILCSVNLSLEIPCDCGQGTLVSVSALSTQLSKPISAVVRVGDHEIAKPALGTIISKKQQVHYCDRYLSNKGSQLQRWSRKFMMAKNDYREGRDDEKDGSATIDESESSPLEGRTVTFDWNPESVRFDVSVSPEIELADADMLQRLIKPSCSGAFLCPTHAGQGNITWDVPVITLRDFVLTPGGGLFSICTKADSEPHQFACLQRTAVWDALEGQVRATLARPSKDDEVDYDRILLSGQISSEFSVPLQTDKPRERRAKIMLKITGVALWNKAQHHLTSIVLDAEGTSGIVDDIFIDKPGGNGIVSAKLETTLHEGRHWELRAQYESLK